ncbi:hypothetical protein BDA99DRAFT_518686 [Phascolomyces articulosus]|uniref:Uncharacterized protein n=1 Tax=Phascolomyces articulosus TaxID=60185 RepID=A0AAD5PBD0_9FUNG|nr:hypothetical protein BDA99DRAFT_518686 [Phascolomyces articulosus]
MLLLFLPHLLLHLLLPLKNIKLIRGFLLLLLWVVLHHHHSNSLYEIKSFSYGFLMVFSFCLIMFSFV